MTSSREYARRWRRQCTVITNIKTKLKPDTTVKAMMALTITGFDDDDDDDDVSAADCCGS